MDAAGECSIAILKRNGEAVPERVANIKDARHVELPAQTPELALISAILATMSIGQVNNVRNNLKKIVELRNSKSAQVAFNYLDQRF